MSKHTAGPIIVERQCSRDGIVTQALKTPSGSTLGYTAFGNVGEPECHANAHLWASAPELLAACKALLSAEFGPDYMTHPQTQGDTMWGRARAAIANAEGK